MAGTYLRLGRSQAGVRSGRGQVVPQLLRGGRGSAAARRRVALRVETGEHHLCSGKKRTQVGRSEQTLLRIESVTLRRRNP